MNCDKCSCELTVEDEMFKNLLQWQKEKNELKDSYRKIKEEKRAIEEKLLAYPDDIISDYSPLRLANEEFERLIAEAPLSKEFEKSRNYFATFGAFRELKRVCDVKGLDSRWLMTCFREFMYSILKDGRLSNEEFDECYEECQKEIEEMIQKEDLERTENE